MKKKSTFLIIGLLVVIIAFVIAMVWLFVLPSFNGNKYGDRLKDDKKHKISSETISKIKDKAKENDSVLKIDYHKEGRILNFTITVDSNYGTDQSKELANSILGEIDEDDRSYYDIQFLIDSSEDSENYPLIGYKSKNSDGINYGNVGG